MVSLLRFALLMTLLWCGQLAAAVDVTIDRNPVQVNESFQLVFSLDRAPDHEPDFTLLQQHFLILGNNRSNSISIINGEYQRSVKWTLQLMAKQIGNYVIPAIRFDDDRSEPFTVEVKPSSLNTVPHEQLVLELLADQQQAPVQAQVIVTLRLLSGQSVSAYKFSDIEVDGIDAVIEPLGEVRQFQTRIADQNYLVLEKRVAVYAQQPGRLTITPVFAEVRLARTGFDPFGGGQVRRVHSPELNVDITPVPANFDGDVWLPAQQVELIDAWQGDLDALVAGEPVTRTITLRAQGLTAAQLPEIVVPAVGGIKQYPDQPALENRRSADGIDGERVQKIALIPGSEGSYRLPEIEVRWWNLQQERMQTARIPAREISVSAAPSTAIAPVSPEEDEAEPAPDAAVAATGSAWIWVSLLLACGWLLTLGLWWTSTRRKTVASEVETPAGDDDLRGARARLQQACRHGDASAARAALLAWGQALLAPRQIPTLALLGEILGPRMLAEIDSLNRALYAANSPEDWRGETLATLIDALERELRDPSGPAPAGLAPLNPTG